MESINSFDVFDTLIGRLCFKGTEIFEIMEYILNIPNFKNIRINCETEGIENIYNNVKNILNRHDIQDIMKLELSLEHDFSFPIWKYLNKIEKNDILISDMYLSTAQIKNLINKHKPIENFLYVSSGGKSSGNIWRNKKIVGNIKLHYGDNYISDYKNAMDNGINAEYIANIELNDIEKNMIFINKELSYIMRAMRLTTQHNESLFNKIFNEFLLPISLYVCMLIKKYSDENDIKNLIFLSRDGYWLKIIYNILYDNYNTKYEYFSREMTKNEKIKIEFIDKMNKIEGKKIFIDLNGSGETFITNYLGKIKDSYYILPFSRTGSYKENNIYKIKKYDPYYPTYFYLEDSFSAPHGSIDFNGNIKGTEYDIEHFKVYMENLEIFKKYYNTYNKYKKLDYIDNYDKILNNIEGLIIKENDNLKLVKNFINHIDDHSLRYEEIRLPFYSQIGQDEYYIKNICKFRCNGFFLDIGAYDGIIGSNTYYLEKNLNWDGILIECNPLSAKKCKENRKSYICNKAIYEKTGDKIEFIIPKGKEIIGGKEQLSGIKNFIKKESAECFKESYEENEIILVDTININDLLQEKNINVINYMSLDVEGYEYEILKMFDFSKYKVEYMTIEHGQIPEYKNKIFTLMISKGYKLARENQWDDEYCL
jgi:FkbM family methyltransferase